jgi:hypothetical protein
MIRSACACRRLTLNARRRFSPFVDFWRRAPVRQQDIGTVVASPDGWTVVVRLAYDGSEVSKVSLLAIGVARIHSQT